MRNDAQLRLALTKIENVAKFAKQHKLAARTIWRLRSGGTARRGTLMLLDAALNEEKT